MHAGLEGVARFQHALAGQGQADLRQPIKETMRPFARGTPVTRSGDHRDVAVAKRKQVARRSGSTIAVMGDHGMVLILRGMRVDAHVAAVDVIEHLRQRSRFGRTRPQDHAVQLLLLHETAHALRAFRILAVAGCTTSS